MRRLRVEALFIAVLLERLGRIRVHSPIFVWRYDYPTASGDESHLMHCYEPFDTREPIFGTATHVDY